MAEDINNSGVICGEFDGNHGFFYDGQNYTQYDIPTRKARIRISLASTMREISAAITLRMGRSLDLSTWPAL